MSITAALAVAVANLLTYGPALLLLRAAWLARRADRLDTSTMHGVWVRLDATRRIERMQVLAGCWLVLYVATFTDVGWLSTLALVIGSVVAARGAWPLAQVVRLGRDLAQHNASHGLLRAREAIA